MQGDHARNHAKTPESNTKSTTWLFKIQTWNNKHHPTGQTHTINNCVTASRLKGEVLSNDGDGQNITFESQ